MAKTSKQVQGDIYCLLRDSVLYTQITGEVYREGLRPRDSRKEDAVVIFTTGVPDEIETGVVTVNIYVPDIDPWHNGVMVEDVERTQQVERLAQEWVDSLTCEVSCYKFHLRQTIYTEEEADIRQHFVVVRLGYEYYAGGDDDAPILLPQDAMIDATDTDEDEGYLPLLETEDGAAIPIVEPVNEKASNNNLIQE